jgi:hypothetical protein
MTKAKSDLQFNKFFIQFFGFAESNPTNVNPIIAMLNKALK